jgi:hypothetical protein
LRLVQPQNYTVWEMLIFFVFPQWVTSDYLEIKANLLAGYRSHRELSIEIETQLPLFIAARCILAVLWFVFLIFNCSNLP